MLVLIGLVFISNYYKSFYFDSFGGTLDKFLLKKLPKPEIFPNFKVQGFRNNLCVSYCLYFFYLLEKITYYDAILKK